MGRWWALVSELAFPFSEDRAMYVWPQVGTPLFGGPSTGRRASTASLRRWRSACSGPARRCGGRPTVSTLDQKVYQAQRELAWLVPNLGADQLTTDLVGWLQMDAEVKRLGGSSDEAES